jgi:tripartite-type tricarboxylate transporter receptor subunit TctC
MAAFAPDMYPVFLIGDALAEAQALGFEASSWYGLGAPMNTPAEIVGVLNKEINAALADPKIKARLTDLGSPVLPGSPADFGKLITAETEKWGKVIRMANIKPQ